MDSGGLMLSLLPFNIVRFVPSSQPLFSDGGSLFRACSILSSFPDRAYYVSSAPGKIISADTSSRILSIPGRPAGRQGARPPEIVDRL